MTDSVTPPVEVENAPTPPSGGETAPPFAGPFFEGIDWLSFSITGALLLVVYLCTLAPDVTLEMSGTMATGAAYAGIPDSGGFPVWTIYSWLFTRLLPFCTIAWRVAVGSAVAASLAGGLVGLMASRGGKLLLENSPEFAHRSLAEQNLIRIVCSCVAGVALGLSGPVWHKAVVVDFWTFGLLLFVTMLCLLMRWSVAPEQKRYLCLAFLAFGMLLTSNWELFFATPALLLVAMLASQKLGRDLFLAVLVVGMIGRFASGVRQLPFFFYFSDYSSLNAFLYVPYLPAAIAAVVAIIMTRGAGSEWKPAACCVLFLFMGLACWFYLPVASMMNPPLNWAYPRTVDGFFHCISRGQYEQIHPTVNLGHYLQQMWMVLKDTGTGLGWVYLPLSILPLCFLHRAQSSARRWMLGLAAVFVCVGPLMVAMLNPSADRQGLELLQPYWSAMYAVLAVLAGMGMMLLAAKTARLGGNCEEAGQSFT